MDKNYEKNRLKARRRREKKNLLIKIMIPLVLLIVIVTTVILLLLSKRTFDTSESAVYVKKSGEILCASIEKLDKDYYSATELEEYVEEQVANFNLQSKDAVKITSFKEDNQQIRLFIKYTSAKAYEQFNGQEFFAGTISQAKKEGYKIPKNAPSDSDLKVLIMEEKIGVKVDGDIVYYSDNMKKLNDHMVTFKDSKEQETQWIWVIYK